MAEGSGLKVSEILEAVSKYLPLLFLPATLLSWLVVFGSPGTLRLLHLDGLDHFRVWFGVGGIVAPLLLLQDRWAKLVGWKAATRRKHHLRKALELLTRDEKLLLGFVVQTGKDTFTLLN